MSTILIFHTHTHTHCCSKPSVLTETFYLIRPLVEHCSIKQCFISSACLKILLHSRPAVSRGSRFFTSAFARSQRINS